MEKIELAIDIRTLEGDLLVPAGTLLNEQILFELQRRAEEKKYKTYRLQDFGSLIKDLDHFLHIPPYGNIFSVPEETALIIEQMKNIRLLAPILDSMEYFRTNDFHTYRHMLMVFSLSTLITKHLREAFGRPSQIHLADPSHDFGKICVPLDILMKKTALTSHELQMLRHHTLAGYILLNYYYNNPAHLSARVARDHHEKKDGSGYPFGHSQIDEMVEIVILCDVYDALISPRPYRPLSYDNRSALEELTRMAEKKQIGWTGLQVLIALNRQNRPDFRNCSISLEKRGIEPEGNMYGKIADEPTDSTPP